MIHQLHQCFISETSNGILKVKVKVSIILRLLGKLIFVTVNISALAVIIISLFVLGEMSIAIESEFIENHSVSAISHHQFLSKYSWIFDEEIFKLSSLRSRNFAFPKEILRSSEYISLKIRRVRKDLFLTSGISALFYSFSIKRSC